MKIGSSASVLSVVVRDMFFIFHSNLSCFRVVRFIYFIVLHIAHVLCVRAVFSAVGRFGCNALVRADTMMAG